MKSILVAISMIFNFCVFSQDVKDAKQLLYHERYRSAEALLHQVVKNDPSNAEAWYLLTQAYLQQNKLIQGADTLKLAPEQIKQEPFYNVAMGSVLIYQNAPEKAKAYFDNALTKTKQKNAKILLAVANAYLDSAAGHANEAINLLAKAIKRDKHNPELYTALGIAYRKLGDGSKAYQAYDKALKEDAGFAKASYLEGMIFVTQKNSDTYLKLFNKAIAADPEYAPAYYQLYFHYYFRDVNTAMDYLKKYISLSDPNPETEYNYIDLLYLTKQYDKAIENANKLINDDDNVKPRLYKLIGYSYKEKGQLDDAISNMKKYFELAPDSIEVVKDFSTMADIYASKKQNDSSALFYTEAVARENDSTELLGYYKKLADIFKEDKNYGRQAYWLGKYYASNSKATNVDLFNWGIANYLNKDYEKSDSVFALYTEKYPDKDFGYYWRAKANVAIDTAMEQGLAIPHYLKVVELAQQDTTSESARSHLAEAYNYLAVYETNHEKNYQEAINYFEKLQEVDPENENAKKYIGILRKYLDEASRVTES